jgi:hypothetical protein
MVFTSPIRAARREASSARVFAPYGAAAVAALPARRCSSANVTSRIAFATATPMAIIAPMNDWKFKLVPVSNRIKSTPQITAGTVDNTTNASFND